MSREGKHRLVKYKWVKGFLRKETQEDLSIEEAMERATNSDAHYKIYNYHGHLVHENATALAESYA
jgi:hypothetical protein